MSEVKKCRECKTALKGRSDKKFCSDHCRNIYNNRRHLDDNYARLINFFLKKNRRILEELLPAKEKMTRVNKEKLLQSGFNFQYHTHSFTNKKGNRYSFCYEYGYLPLENDWYLVVKRIEKK